MNVLTMPLSFFRKSLQDLLRRPGLSIRCGLGASRWDGHLELIATPTGIDTGRDLQMVLTEQFDRVPALTRDNQALLLLGLGRLRGRATGLAEGNEPLHQLRLVGPGMHRLILQDGVPGNSFTDWLERPATQELWSRTVGALGIAAWRRLVGIHFGIVGCGRTGSILLFALARLGVRRLTILDPDRIEAHNLGEMEGINDQDVGTFKVDALAASIRRSASHVEISSLPESVSHWRALRALQACDFLLCASDHDSSRLATTILGVLMCKPMLDIATGIHQGTRRLMGADIRLVCGRCLLCHGGLRHEQGARRALQSAQAEVDVRTHRDWRQERSGSLSSLNHLAASIALRLLEDFLTERAAENVWVHIEFDDNGRMHVSYPEPDVRTGAALGAACPICRLAGMGELGLERVPDLLRETGN